MVPVIVDEKIPHSESEKLARATFREFAKVCVDIKREVLAIGCDIHSQCAEALLDNGSRKEDIWGANVYPFYDHNNRISYTSNTVNVRPQQGNHSSTIEVPEIREKVKQVIERLLF